MKTLTESVPRDDSLPRREEFRAEINQEKSALQMEESSAVQRAMEFAKLNYMLDSKTRLSPSDPVDDMDNEYPDQEADVDLEILELEAQALQVELELLDF